MRLIDDDLQASGIRAGTLDDTTWLRPVAHFFMRSAQPWETIADAGTCHDTGSKEFASPTSAWRAMWSKDSST